MNVINRLTRRLPSPVVSIFAWAIALAFAAIAGLAAGGLAAFYLN